MPILNGMRSAARPGVANAAGMKARRAAVAAGRTLSNGRSLLLAIAIVFLSGVGLPFSSRRGSGDFLRARGNVAIAFGPIGIILHDIPDLVFEIVKAGA